MNVTRPLAPIAVTLDYNEADDLVTWLGEQNLDDECVVRFYEALYAVLSPVEF